MEHIIHNLSLNMQSSISQVSLSVKKGDTMRKLRINLTDNGTPYNIAEGCEAVFSAKKESGWILYNNCTIDYENNIIVYEFTHGTAIMPGKLDCEIKLYDADKNLITSPQFTIIVNNSVHEDGEVEDSNEFTELTEMVSATKALKEEFEALLEKGVSSSRIAYVDLLASNWQGTESPYSQVVAVEGATENSQVDLTPSVEQLSIFHNKDLAFVTENEDGVVTVYAIGQKPTNDYTIQVTITEVAV